LYKTFVLFQPGQMKDLCWCALDFGTTKARIEMAAVLECGRGQSAFLALPDAF
jgi:hypothetical protein